jgi:hypothetical protein
MLEFSEANQKTAHLYDISRLRKFLLGGRRVYSIDLLSGWSCPGAKDCLSKVFVDEQGKKSLQDGPDTEFRCFSASQEVAFPNVYNRRLRNWKAIAGLRTAGQIATAIRDAIPGDAGVIRIHVAGDFFKRAYWQAWQQVADARPDVLFYAYTKMINLMVGTPMADSQHGIVKPNLLVTASIGGKYDHLIGSIGLRTAVVVYNANEARQLQLPIDNDDSHAATPGKSFALLIHGVQPKGSDAAYAVNILRQARK